jgi:acetyl esterase/lipase
MKRFWLAVPVIVAVALPCATYAADKPQELFVWPKELAAEDDATGIQPNETTIFPVVIYATKKTYIIGGQPVTSISNVTKPTLTVYRPQPEKDTGAAVVICPGGGYWDLMIDQEGEEVARWLVEQGITGIVLKYRVPRRKGEPQGQPPTTQGPLKDAQRAISSIRYKAQNNEWGKQRIDPNRIGMIGFSVGGHLVAQTCTAEKRAYKEVDQTIDKVSCRPDFGILCYSGYLKETNEDKIHHTLNATAQAPPLFLVHSGDDPTATVEHSVVFYLAMRRAGARVQLHVYEKGSPGFGHGFSVRKTNEQVDEWRSACASWMRDHGFLTPPAPK